MSDEQPPPSGDGIPTPPPAAPSYEAPAAPPSYPSYPAGDGGGDAGHPGAPGYADQPGAPAPYDVGAAFSTGFRLFGKHWAAFVVLALISIVISVALGLVGILASHHGSFDLGDNGGGFSFYADFNPTQTILQVIGGIISTLFSAAMIKGALDAVDGRPVSIGGMFEGWDKLQILIAAVVVNILVFVGFLLIIIPGLIVLFLTWFANYFIVDSGKSAFEAISAGASFASKHIGPLLLTGLLAIITNIVGACLCGVGLFVTLPVTIIMAAVAFRQLQGRGVVTG